MAVLDYGQRLKVNKQQGFPSKNALCLTNKCGEYQIRTGGGKI